jgi:hypothetical protein
MINCNKILTIWKVDIGLCKGSPHSNQTEGRNLQALSASKGNPNVQPNTTDENIGIGTVRPKSSSHVFSLLEVKQDSLVQPEYLQWTEYHYYFSVTIPPYKIINLHYQRSSSRNQCKKDRDKNPEQKRISSTGSQYLTPKESAKL